MAKYILLVYSRTPDPMTRPVIETIHKGSANMYQVDPSKHRSFNRFVTEPIEGLIGCSLFDKKPCNEMPAC